MWLVFDPRKGHEQAGRRPAIVLSPQLFTERVSLAFVCPITTNPKGLPFEIPLRGTRTTGSILPIHLRSVDVAARKIQFIEKAPATTVDTLERYVSAIIERAPQD